MTQSTHQLTPQQGERTRTAVQRIATFTAAARFGAAEVPCPTTLQARYSGQPRLRDAQVRTTTAFEKTHHGVQ